jgi:hypothetical protein
MRSEKSRRETEGRGFDSRHLHPPTHPATSTLRLFMKERPHAPETPRDDHQVVPVVVQHPSLTLIDVRAAISSVPESDKADRYPRPATFLSSRFS